MNNQFLQRYLGFDPKTMNLRTEIIAGITTFLTMSYILAVNPDILSAASMDKGAVFTATALSSALATILLAFLAKLPLAQAPSMGINAFFAYTLVLGMGYSWQTALTVVLVEGIIFVLLTIFNIRDKIIDCIPLNLRYAISVGIGMFIAFIGLKNIGLIVQNDATLVALGSFTPTALIGIFGILLSGILCYRKVKGALFIGIIVTTLVGIPFGVTNIPEGFSLVSSPQSMAPTFFQFDFSSLLDFDLIVVTLIMVFMDLFNTIGTLVGAANQAGMVTKEGNIPHMKEALLSDAVGTCIGAVCGTSTVTTFVESSAGIAEGGRSGVTSLVTGLLFILALFFSPLFLVIPGAATAGALFLVGVFMMNGLRDINFDDMTEALPAFVTILTMVLTYSIAEGIVLGMLSYCIMKIFTGRFKDIHPALYVLAVLFVLKYIWG
ncbi:MAG: NCS2 family permease [Parabacteroides sp.]|nr:NCS2 family permease [Parabacteroides sp.]